MLIRRNFYSFILKRVEKPLLLTLRLQMLLKTLTLNFLNLKQCLAHDSIKKNLKHYGGSIFRLAKPNCEITGREDSLYENFISKSTLKVKNITV